MLRSLLLIFALLVLHVTQAQYTITGKVIDVNTAEPLKGCHIGLQGDDPLTVSDGEGTFMVYIPSAEFEEVNVEFRHLGYETQILALSDTAAFSYRHGVYFAKVALRYTAYQLDTLAVNSEYKPDLVYGSEQHSIADYVFVGDSILLLAYEKRLNKASRLLLVNQSMIVLDSLDIPEGIRARNLVRDYADLLYLETRDRIFHIETGPQLRLHAVDKQVYHDQVEPVIDTLKRHVYFSTWTPHLPTFDFYSYNTIDCTYKRIRRIADEKALELCRAEFKYLTSRDKLKMFRLELETGVEKELLTCMATYQDGLYYKPIYAPMFVWEEELLIFDHPAEVLFKYDLMGVSLDSVPIHYHRPDKVMNNDFAHELVMDELTGQVYALFQKPGGACRLMGVNLDTGEIEESIRLTYDYPSAVRVKGGEVYYTYRPFESSQKKYLYKEIIGR